MPKPGKETPRYNELQDPDFLADSVLARNDMDRTFIRQWLNCEKPQSKLLYKATRDGFSAETFHRLCDR